LEGVTTGFGVKSGDSYRVQELGGRGFDHVVLMVRECAGNIFNKGFYLLALPDRADGFKYVVGDEGREAFDLEEKIGALRVKLSHTKGDCWGGPDSAFQEEGAFSVAAAQAGSFENIDIIN
jgi:hypothetical protein